MLLPAIAAAKSPEIANIAANIASDAKQSSKEKQFLRCLDEPNITQASYAKALVDVLKLGSRPFELIMDRTNWKSGKIDVNIFVLAIRVDQSLVIPLFFMDLEGGKKGGSSNSDERIELLQLFLDVFHADRIGWLLGDREFASGNFLKFLLEKKINFLLRIKKSHFCNILNENNIKIADFSQAQKCKIYGQDVYVGGKSINPKPRKKTKKRSEDTGQTNIAEQDSSMDDDTLVLISNKVVTKESLQLYRNRWGIETMFKQFKSDGFNLERSGLKTMHRMLNLILLISITIVSAYLFGKDKVEKPRLNKKRGTPQKSLFKQILEYLINWLVKNRSSLPAYTLKPKRAVQTVITCVDT